MQYKAELSFVECAKVGAPGDATQPAAGSPAQPGKRGKQWKIFFQVWSKYINIKFEVDGKTPKCLRPP